MSRLGSVIAPKKLDTNSVYLMLIALVLFLLATSQCSARTEIGRFDQLVDQLANQLMDQLIDNSASTSRRFSQKYAINSDFAESDDAPVIYYFGAEVGLPDTIFREPFISVARAMKARFVALENRYYGSSQPEKNLDSKSMEFLRISQILIDYRTFQDYLIKSKGFKGKWIAIGDSFGGLLASAYRLEFSGFIVGAIASSAPLHFSRDATEADRFAAKTAGADPRVSSYLRKDIIAWFQSYVLN